jgi:hypothetical protein
LHTDWSSVLHIYTNNTVPNGIITKDIQGLITLANELAKKSGINYPFTNLMEN